MNQPTRILPFAPNRAASSPSDQNLDQDRVDALPLLGPSAVMAQLWAQIRRVAPYFRTALLTGEPGCGEVGVARALHGLSPTAGQPFLSLPADEAELRLSAIAQGPILSEAGGIFLPEPERLSRTAQIGLRRLLRERGPMTPRVIVFAVRGLRPLISAGSFSAELADALGGLRIALPPLRERTEDIPLLASELLRLEAARRGVPAPILTPDFLAAATAAPWPGNLRQLGEALDQMLSGPVPQDTLHAADLAAALEITDQKPVDRRAPRMVSLDQVLQEHIRAVLVACGGNKLRAAAVLGISRSTLYRMLEQQAPVAPGASPRFSMAV